MSANSWSRCPVCLQKARQALEKAQDLYGKVSRDEYFKRLNETAADPSKVEYKFRDDWEIGMQENGELIISYSGSCQECGFSVNFKHEQNYLEEKREES